MLGDGLLVEHRHRNGRHAVFTGQPQRHVNVVQVRANLRIIHQLEISPRRGFELKARRRQQFAKQVALGLVEGRQLFDMLGVRRHEISQRPLQRRHAAEVDVLVDLAQLGTEGRWRHHITGFPAGDVVGLAKRADHEGARVQRFMGQHAGVLHAVEHQVLVDFVADQIDITLGDQQRQLVQVIAADQRAAGVVRRVEDDHPCAWAEGVGELLPVDGKLTVSELDMHAAPARQFHRRLIAVVTGVEDDDLIARADYRMDSTEDRFGGTGGDGDFMLGIDADAIAAGDLVRHLLAQGRQAGHRAVLVMSGTDMPADRIEQCLRAVEIGETLGQVQGAGLRGELGHGGKDGRADVRQLATDHGALFPASLSGSRRRGLRPSIAD
ncbi:hypothetical protein D9M71_327660 [compost metagenome]